MLLVAVYVLYSFNALPAIEALFSNAAFAGIFGVLAGVIGGGLVSVYVQRKQIEAESALKRKHEIYIPLYNDMIESIKATKTPGFPSLNAFPYETEWIKIKQDQRYIDTPDYLVTVLNGLYKVYEEYKEAWEKAEAEISASVERIIIVKHNARYNIANIGVYLLLQGLPKPEDTLKHFRNLYSSYHLLRLDDEVRVREASRRGEILHLPGGSMRLSDEEMLELGTYIVQRVTELQAYQELERKYKRFSRYLEQVLQLLYRIVNQIDRTYGIKGGTY